MPSEIAIPFRLDSLGRITAEKRVNAQIRQHVMSLINTEPSERAVLGGYGVALVERLFTGDDEHVAPEIADMISAAFLRWEPGVTLAQIAPVPGPQGDGLATVDIRYRRSDAPDSDVTGTGTNVAIIGRGGHVNEVVRG